MSLDAARPEDFLATLQAAALEYAALGHAIFPVSAEKFPLTPHGFKSASTLSSQIRYWFSTDFPRHGKVYGIGWALPEGITAVDVDPRSGGSLTLEALTDTHGQLPDTVNAMTGGGGAHFLFRTPENFQVRNLGKGIDIKRGGASYLIVEPSLHVSGCRYWWEASASLLEENPTIAPAPEWMLEPMIKRDPGRLISLPNSGHIPEAQEEDLRSALATIPPDDYDTWIRIGQALHATEAGETAFRLWDDWSQTSLKYKPGETACKWQTFRSDGGRNVETVFKVAEQNGWVNPLTAPDSLESFRALIEDCNQVKDLQTIELPSPAHHSLPVSGLQEIESWVAQRVGAVCPRQTQAAVLALASALVTRRYVDPTNNPLHIYSCLISGSVSNCRGLKDALYQLLAETGYRIMIRGSRIGSLHTLYRTLETCPTPFYVADDFGAMLAFSRRQPSGVLDQALNALADLYQGGSIFVDADIDGPKGQSRIICQPGMGLVAMVPEDQLPNLTRQSEIGRGLLQQMIMVEAGDPAPTSPRLRPVSDEVISALQAVAAPVGSVIAAGVPPNPQPVLQTPEAEARLHECRQALKALSGDDRRLAPLCHGALSSISRLASVLAVWQAPKAPVLSASLVEWAGEFIISHLRYFAPRFLTVANGSGELDPSQDVLRVIFNAGADGISFRELRNYSWTFRNLSQEQRDQMIESLTTDQMIHGLKPKGRRSVRYFHHSFIKEAAPAPKA